ncbi:MAG TPA: FlgD immunoglobulin-like domain containing protein, partial [bacterium]|nr:FlgD immunoglobulin-like domain containing protein [bacterium]
VSFTLDRDVDVRLTVHDAAGRRVRTLVDGPRTAGAGTADWDGRDASGRRVTAGIYFVRLETDGEPPVSRKLALLR